ncbi:HU family DNA-binding protein [Neptunomonas antarctica]|uniref:Bacterial nucleoid protein Hbs n=1 Tax=Neptunomonas antarctica TaxID=619304 RepID=A0A1N7MQJ2_9GAMM|nr:HU family DNA-binding protein [Neptunomonas antarctica]SIS88221.1 bacterial nucleoid protein Hbs [Neptunomonas antarctica]
MNKSELIEAVTSKMKIEHDRVVNKADVEALLNSLTSVTKTALVAGDEVTLIGLGKFSTGHRAARTGRNPQTGAPLDIAAATTAKFTPAKALKDALN